MVAHPARATRRATSAASGPRRADGRGGRHVRLTLVWACSSAELRALRFLHTYALTVHWPRLPIVGDPA